MFEVNAPIGLIGVFNTEDDAKFFAITWMNQHQASTVITTGDRIVCALLCKKEMVLKEPNAPRSIWGKAMGTLSGLNVLAKAKKQLERQRLRNIRLANKLNKERNRVIALQNKLSDLKTYQPPSYPQGGVNLPFTT